MVRAPYLAVVLALTVASSALAGTLHCETPLVRSHTQAGACHGRAAADVTSTKGRSCDGCLLENLLLPADTRREAPSPEGPFVVPARLSLDPALTSLVRLDPRTRHRRLADRAPLDISLRI